MSDNTFTVSGAWELAKIQEQSAKYGVDAGLSGYAALTRSTELPQSWLQTSLGDVVDYGKVEKAEPNNISDDTWVLELEDIEKDSSKITQRLNFLDRQSKSTKNRFKKGDVLYGKLRPYLNKVVVADSNGVCTTEIIPLSGGENLDNRYLFFWLKHPIFLAYVSDVGYGVNMPRLGTKDGIAAPFVLAPFAEQQQIAAKLDELLAQVDILKTRLDAIPKIIKRFRQSVLAAAVSGKLTEDWRGEEKYPWVNTTLGNVFRCIDGDRGPNYPKKDEYKKEGYCLFLSTKNVRAFGFDFTDQVFLDKKKHEVLRNGTLERGDLVLTTRGTLGYIGSYDDKVPFEVVRINSGMLILRKLIKDYKNEFFKILIASPKFQKQIADQKTGSAQPQLPAKILKEFILDIPTIEEQTEIVRQVEQLLTYADQIEQRVKDAQARVNHLTQSILAKAFRGELTADWREQNPDLISGENSAEVLLAKIKAERETVAATKKIKRKAS